MSLEMGSLSGAEISYQRALEQSSASNVEKLKGAASKAGDATTDEELMDACKQFESYLLEQVMKEMQKTVDIFSKDKDKNSSVSQVVSFFKESTVTQLCKSSTDRSPLGIAQMMYENLKHTRGISADSIKKAE